MERILVIGGTGRLGQPVVLALASAGYQVRVFSRQATLPRVLQQARIEHFRGDLSQITDLAMAMQNVQAVYLNLPETANPRASFIAEQHGVENVLRVIPPEVLLLKLSVLDAAETPHFHDMTLKFRAEERIRAAGNPFIIFRPSWFMETLPLVLVQKQHIFVIGAQPAPLHWIAAQDFAAQVVTAIRQRSVVANRIFNVQGPEALTFMQAAQRYAQAQPDKLHITTIPLWVMRLGGLVDAEQHAHYELMAYHSRYREQFISGDTWQLLGRPTTTLDHFAAAWRDQPNIQF